MGRITIDGTQVQYSTRQEIQPDLWDSKKSRCKGNTDEARNINRHLNDWETKIEAKHKEMVCQKGYVSAELLKQELFEDKQNNGFLIEEAKRFIEEARPLVGTSLAKSTFGNYIYATKLIQSYLREELAQEDIRYALLDYSFIEELNRYLKVERQLSLATIQIVVIFLRRLIGVGQQKRYIRKDPFADFKAELPQRVRRYLTTEELQRVLTTPIIDKQFERANSSLSSVASQS